MYSDIKYDSNKKDLTGVDDTVIDNIRKDINDYKVFILKHIFDAEKLGELKMHFFQWFHRLNLATQVLAHSS